MKVISPLMMSREISIKVYLGCPTCGDTHQRCCGSNGVPHVCATLTHLDSRLLQPVISFCHLSPHALKPQLLPGHISLSSPSQLSLLPEPLVKPFLGCPTSLQLLLLLFFLLLPPAPAYNLLSKSDCSPASAAMAAWLPASATAQAPYGLTGWSAAARCFAPATRLVKVSFMLC